MVDGRSLPVSDRPEVVDPRASDGVAGRAGASGSLECDASIYELIGAPHEGGSELNVDAELYGQRPPSPTALAVDEDLYGVLKPRRVVLEMTQVREKAS